MIPPEKDSYLGKDGMVYCCKCNTPREKVLSMTFAGGKLIRASVMCDCQKKAYEAEVAEKLKREFEEYVYRNRSVCFAEQSMWKWTFTSAEETPLVTKGRQYVDAWDEVTKKNIGLLLWGGVGTGKTFVAGCIANALLDQGKKVLMRDFAQISNISVFEVEDYVSSLSSYDLVILDDLGSERSSEFSLQNVFNVINRRYETGKPLIITTNHSVEELKKEDSLDRKRIYDRVLAMCTPILATGDSLRQREASEKYADLKGIFEEDKK